MCDGVITIDAETGEMCATGKVTYGQLQAASGKDRPIYQLTAEEVSINGHMTGGSGYVWLGPEVRYLYDFITSYTVNGVTYPNDHRINDNLLAASRGSIDGVCLSAEFRQYESFYEISHRTSRTRENSIPNMDDIRAGSYTFISRYFTVIEYHTPRESDGAPLIDRGSTSYRFTSFLTNAFSTITAPDITATDTGVFGFFPTNAFAPLARLTISGIVSTVDFPVPVSAPDDITEAIQIDTEYKTLMAAIENGLFTKKRIPVYYYVRFKRVVPLENSNSCWKEPAVILEITGPQGDGEGLDAWVDDVVYPALIAEGGTIGLHFGKRIPPGTQTTRAALKKYKSCGVELNLDPAHCYHPQCKRKVRPSSFVYPDQYYDFVG